MSAVKGTEQVIKNLSTMEKGIVDEIVNGVTAVQAKFVNEARGILPHVTGTLAQSIQAGDITITDDNVEAIVEANAEYASYVEFGTGTFAGHQPYFPNIDALKDWCRTVLGDEKLAFVVARSIFRRGGIAPLQFMGQTLMANIDVFRRAIDAAVRRGIEAHGI